MSEQENPIERNATVIMPRFQSAMHDLSTKFRELQQEAEAKRLAELRSLIHEELDRMLDPSRPDSHVFIRPEVARDPLIQTLKGLCQEINACIASAEDLGLQTCWDDPSSALEISNGTAKLIEARMWFSEAMSKIERTEVDET